jgi:hypothetical protein
MGRPKERCAECAKIAQKTQIEQWLISHHIPLSARNGKYFQYWKFLITLNLDELTALHGVKRRECRFQKDSVKIGELRTQIKLIDEGYKYVKEKEK